MRKDQGLGGACQESNLFPIFLSFLRFSFLTLYPWQWAPFPALTDVRMSLRFWLRPKSWRSGARDWLKFSPKGQDVQFRWKTSAKDRARSTRHWRAKPIRITAVYLLSKIPICENKKKWLNWILGSSIQTARKTTWNTDMDTHGTLIGLRERPLDSPRSGFHF